MLSVVFPFRFHRVNYNSQGLVRMPAARPHRVTTCGKTEYRKFLQSKAIQTCPPSRHCCDWTAMDPLSAYPTPPPIGALGKRLEDLDSPEKL
ncbi:hypothetical protein R6Z07F_010526 [Ovis aries]